MLKTAHTISTATDNPLPLPRELAKQSLPSYVVEPGDVLLLEPVDFDNTLRLPGDQTVQPDGTIDLGIYGTLQASGKTVNQIQTEAQKLIDSYARDKGDSEASDGESDEDSGTVNVRLVEPTSKMYYVTGEVN